MSRKVGMVLAAFLGVLALYGDPPGQKEPIFLHATTQPSEWELKMVREHAMLSEGFGTTLDIYMSVDELHNGKPALAQVTVSDFITLSGQSYFIFIKKDGTNLSRWTVNAASIVAASCNPGLDSSKPANSHNGSLDVEAISRAALWDVASSGRRGSFWLAGCNTAAVVRKSEPHQSAP